MGNFHRRLIKKDGKGPYLQKGGARFRPFYPVVTRHRVGATVSVVFPQYMGEICRVFTNHMHYEEWG